MIAVKANTFYLSFLSLIISQEWRFITFMEFVCDFETIFSHLFNGNEMVYFYSRNFLDIIFMFFSVFIKRMKTKLEENLLKETNFLVVLLWPFIFEIGMKCSSD